MQILCCHCMVLNPPPVKSMEARRSRTGPDYLSSSPRAEAWSCSASTVAIWVLNLPPVNGGETLQDWPGLPVLLPKRRRLVVQRLYRGRMVLNLPPVNGGETLQDWPGLSVLLPKSGGLVVQRLYGGLVVLQLLGHLLVLLQQGLHVPCTQDHSFIKMIIICESPLNLGK
jgi:hypothetical protein